MSTIVVRDLALSKELDSSALATVRGGSAWLDRVGVGATGPLANVNININQSVQQLQQINVAALNNNGVIGSSLGRVKISVDPSQWGGNWAAV